MRENLERIDPKDLGAVNERMQVWASAGEWLNSGSAQNEYAMVSVTPRRSMEFYNPLEANDLRLRRRENGRENAPLGPAFLIPWRETRSDYKTAALTN